MLEEFSLHKEADKPFRLYSTGMKYKLLIIRALIGDPDILILDEPTSHIDPVTRDNIHVFIRQYIISQCRKTVILCTHDLSEAQTLADHLILLNKGKVIAQGTFNELNKLIKSEIIYEICFFIKPDDVFFKNYPDFYFDREAGFYQFELPTINAVPELIRKAVEYNGKIRWCKDHKETLFEIFKRLTNNN